MHNDSVPGHVQFEYRRTRRGWIEFGNFGDGVLYVFAVFSKLDCSEGGCGVDDKVARFCDICAGDPALEVGPVSSHTTNGGVEVSYEAVKSNGGGRNWMSWPTCDESVGGMLQLSCWV